MKKILRVRISDNVLDDEDFPIRRLTFEGTVVVEAEDEKPGVYSFDDGPQVGWTKSQVVDWLALDTTGRHPEIFHEGQMPDGRWLSVSRLVDIE